MDHRSFGTLCKNFLKPKCQQKKPHTSHKYTDAYSVYAIHWPSPKSIRIIIIILLMSPNIPKRSPLINRHNSDMYGEAVLAQSSPQKCTCDSYIQVIHYSSVYIYTNIFLYKHMHTLRLPHEIIYVWISDVIVAVILYIECLHTVSSTRLDETVAALGSSNI